MLGLFYFRVKSGSLEHVALEYGIPETVGKQLQDMGHGVTAHVAGFGRSLFGRGQIIARGNWPFKPDNDCYWAGTDPRADGTAIGY